MNVHGRRSRIALTAICLWLMTSAVASAQALSIDLDAEGGLDILFQGLDLLGDVEGNIDMTGRLSVEGGIMEFSASGWAGGIGVHHVLLLSSKGWILWSATGLTVGGRSIDLRGLLYVPPHPMVSIQTGDALEGLHHTAIRLDGAVATYDGTWTGTVEGGLAAPKVAGTLRIEGSVNIHLQGNEAPGMSPACIPESIPLDDLDIAEGFRSDVAVAFDFSKPWFPSSAQDQP